MHVTNYAKLLFFINNLLSLIISATDVLCLEELKPDLMVRVWERRKALAENDAFSAREAAAH